MRAFLKNNRQAPRKVRLVARAMVGKNVSVALAELSFMPQKGAGMLKKLIASALANAKQKEATLAEKDLVVKNITVDKGITYARHMPRAFGRASPIHRECSHVRVELAHTAQSKVTPKVITEEKKTEEKAKKVEKVKTEKKAPVKKTKKETK